jgi:hypothetical protein
MQLLVEALWHSGGALDGGAAPKGACRAEAVTRPTPHPEPLSHEGRGEGLRGRTR